MKDIVNRFFSYVSFDTQSSETSGKTPSSDGQMVFAKHLAGELRMLGLSEVEVSEYGYVTATIPATTQKSVPTIGFIAHMDTSPDYSGRNVRPRIVRNYKGGDVELSAEPKVIMKVADFPELLHYKGQDLIVADSDTLLGADDKAGIAAIVSAASYLLKNVDIEHGKIRICFTPDEEIGEGADHFDVEKFGADWAYTVDGGEIGELEYETFNAAEATLTFHGRNVHPGYAYHKMRNSMRLAASFVDMLPRHETPEHTQGYEGFYHLIQMNGTVENSTLKYIIRDFNRDRFESRKREMEHLVNKMNAEFGDDTVEIALRDQYYNMREKIEPVKHVVELAKQAMTECGIEPKTIPVRGGTDGARLSFMGLPTPNLFAGGLNFHGRYEFLPVNSLQKAAEVVAKIAVLAAK
ncbi:MAG: peptidase T [Bacteroidales bacterium]|nr:peptidase T [Bacteroidales bacterium]